MPNEPPRTTMREGRMRSQNKFVVVFVAVAAAASAAVRSQEGEGAGTARTPSASPEARKFLAPPNQVVAIRGARLFDARSGRILADPVIIVRGERIAEAGAGVQVPAGATVIDLGAATVLPGMIDGHVHLNLNAPNPRSEERRVGKECRSRWAPDHLKKKKKDSRR